MAGVMCGECQDFLFVMFSGQGNCLFSCRSRFRQPVAESVAVEENPVENARMAR